MGTYETFRRIRTLHGVGGSRAGGAPRRDKTTRRRAPQESSTESKQAWAEAETKGYETFRLGPRKRRPLVGVRFFPLLACYLSPREALADNLPYRQVKTFAVSQRRSVQILSVIEAEHLLINVSLKVNGINADISSLQTALKQAPEVFHPVHVYAALNIAFRFVDDLVCVESGRQALIGVVFVGVESGARFNIRQNVCVNIIVLPRRRNSSLYAALSLKQAENNRLVSLLTILLHAGSLCPMHVNHFSANEGFISLNLIAQHRGLIVAKRKADAMKHRPCRLLANPSGAVEFIRAISVLAVGQHPHRHEPLVETNRGVLKNRPNLDAELRFGVPSLTLP